MLFSECKNQSDGCWYSLNDESVFPINIAKRQYYLPNNAVSMSNEFYPSFEIFIKIMLKQTYRWQQQRPSFDQIPAIWLKMIKRTRNKFHSWTTKSMSDGICLENGTVTLFHWIFRLYKLIYISIDQYLSLLYFEVLNRHINMDEELLPTLSPPRIPPKPVVPAYTDQDLPVI
jgi:hypothetical protein